MHYAFQGDADGAVPYGLTLDKDGNGYGTTQLRGSGPCSSSYQSCGTVFEVTPVRDDFGVPTGGWTKRVIYTFKGGADGANPYAALVGEGAGNLHGTTIDGGGTGCGGFGCGVVFKLSRVDGRWTETVLYRFTGGVDGGTPESPVTLDSSGNISARVITGGFASATGSFPAE
jgi:hypothetical protein